MIGDDAEVAPIAANSVPSHEKDQNHAAEID
jgi:hypothetical protein